MADEEVIQGMIAPARRWVAAVHRGDKASMQRIVDTLPGPWEAFAVVLGAMIEPGRHPEDLLGWTEDLLTGERERLESEGVAAETAEFLARQVATRKDSDRKLIGLSPDERREVLARREHERSKRATSRARTSTEPAAPAPTIRERMLETSQRTA